MLGETVLVPNVASPVEFTRIGAGELTLGLVESAAALLQQLVTAGAALGWVDAPSTSNVHGLMMEVAADVDLGNAALVVARSNEQLIGLGYWRRYVRPTHSPHADIEKVAVDSSWQGRGVGRGLMMELMAAANDAAIEVLTLDLRGDNERAIVLYESLGFRRYGLLERFVAVGNDRYDKLFYALHLREARPSDSQPSTGHGWDSIAGTP